MDGLAQDWRDEVIIAVPPPGLLIKTLLKFQSDRCTGMMIYPECSKGLLEAVWSSKLRQGKLAEWKFFGRGKLGANVETRYDETYEGKLVVTKLDFSNLSSQN